jgi:hypothetical protein
MPIARWVPAMNPTAITDRHPAQSPVSDVTYDLMQALTSRLEAIEASEVYREDATGDVQRLFDEMLDDDRRHAERLLDALRSEIA